LQDEAQWFHWSNAQATIHSFVIYFKKSDALNTEPENLVMIPYCLKHDSILVHIFRRHLMKFIENTFESPLKRIVYFSDGSAAQYKNRRNLLKITCHNENFRVALLCNIPWEDYLWWGWRRSKMAWLESHCPDDGGSKDL
jgi:hypothetical protein